MIWSAGICRADDQACDDPPAFTRKDVVGPAGRCGVHHLKPYALRHQGLQQGWMGKLLPRSRADDDDLRSQCDQAREVGLGQRRESGASPGFRCRIDAETNALQVADMVDLHEPLALCGNAVGGLI